MAVERVWGRLNNGVSVDFTQVTNNVWEVTLGENSPDGRYVAEVWASDHAGNVAYKMAVIWVVSGKVTCLRFIENKYSCRFICPVNCGIGEITMSGKKYIKFLLGEKRPLEFEAYTTDGSDFVIDEAKYTIYRYNSIIEEGDMKVDGHILSYLFAPKERGYYVFDVSYTVGSVVEVKRFEINVD